MTKKVNNLWDQMSREEDKIELLISHNVQQEINHDCVRTVQFSIELKTSHVHFFLYIICTCSNKINRVRSFTTTSLLQ